MKFLREILIAAIGGIIGEASAMQAVPAPTLFDLPAGTPGRQVYPQGHPRAGQPNLVQKNIDDDDTFSLCEHAVVPGTNHHIYFPTNGMQPTTRKAARYACANAATVHGTNEYVTDWYVRAFGGDTAVWFSQNLIGPEPQDNALQMGFGAGNAAAHLIRIDATQPNTPADFERQFWQTFRTIASNPVGRVLLYRIIIEVRRTENGQGRCENQINPQNWVLNRRNGLRSISIVWGKLFFGEDKISFKNDNTIVSSLRIGNNQIDTYPDRNNYASDIGLFHEILHWFHYLRHPQRHIGAKLSRPKTFRLVVRCYYGDYRNLSELYTWKESGNEEVAAILGSPNYNKPRHLGLIAVGSFLANNPGNAVFVRGEFVPFANRFLEGDDLSENAYRMSRLDENGRRYRMRFGHGGDINPVSIANGIPDRFRLAHLVATNCYQEITGQAINWGLVAGEAAQ